MYNGSSNKSCSGVILAGGLNSRMNGVNKSFLKLGGQYYIDRIARIVSKYFVECIVVTRDDKPYQHMQMAIVKDILKARSPLAGIHTGLATISSKYAFCISCDMPLLHSGVVKLLLDGIEDGFDIIVPFSGTYFQPLCAIYSRQCVPIIEAQLNKGDMKVDHLYQSLRIKKISYETISKIDPNLISFFNVNTSDDAEKAKQIYQYRKGNLSHLICNSF